MKAVGAAHAKISLKINEKKKPIATTKNKNKTKQQQPNRQSCIMRRLQPEHLNVIAVRMLG